MPLARACVVAYHAGVTRVMDAVDIDIVEDESERI
jgi:hypothetical protein